MLEKANRPDPNNPAEAEAFREQAEKLMAKYGISEEECQPQQTRRPSGGYGNPYSSHYGSSADWMRDYFNDVFFRAAEEAKRREREEAERQARSKAQQQKTLAKILEDLQTEGQAFVADELLYSLYIGLDEFVSENLGGWNLAEEHDLRRCGWWIRTQARQAARDEERAKERKAEQEARKRYTTFTDTDGVRWTQAGTVSDPIFVSEDEPILDELADYLDGVNEELRRKNFDHKFCTHPKTPGARARCRRDRQASGF